MVVPLEAWSAQDPDIVQFIGLAADVDEPPGSHIYNAAASPASGDMPVVCAFALAGGSAQDIEPDLRSIFHLLPPGPGVAQRVGRLSLSGYLAALILRSLAISTSPAR